MVERLQSLLTLTLRLSSPVLSGNMKSLITQYAPTKTEARIVIDAPFYDMKQWRKTHTIVHTGAVISGRTTCFIFRLPTAPPPFRSPFPKYIICRPASSIGHSDTAFA